MARLNDRDLELLKFDDRLLLSSLKEAPEENGRQQSPGFLYRFTNRFSNALGLVINEHILYSKLDKFLCFIKYFG